MLNLGYICSKMAHICVFRRIYVRKTHIYVRFSNIYSRQEMYMCEHIYVEMHIYVGNSHIYVGFL